MVANTGKAGARRAQDVVAYVLSFLSLPSGVGGAGWMMMTRRLTGVF